MAAKPDYVLKANVSKEGKPLWVTIGVGWRFDLAEGKEGISVRVNALPLNWDGSMSIFPVNGE